jgi:glycosyltransferase involved in cell wall biosynthesis
VTDRRRRLLFFAYGFPPAAKSSAYRLRETANQFVDLGWDVTVVNGDHRCFEDDYGLDLSMLEHVDPRVLLEELPLRRPDLETDVRKMTQARVTDPRKWAKRWDRKTLDIFPEVKFGGWRGMLEEAAVRLHCEEPFDLVLASCAPYVFLAPALRLYEEFGVPYAVDFRDGWSIDVVEGEVAFALGSDAGLWEARAMDKALSLWVVNEPIAEHYRARYPNLADRIEVVRNGFDIDSVPRSVVGRDHGDNPLRFGYLGTINYQVETLRAVLDAWRDARRCEPALADATLTFRGYLGASWAREATPTAELIREARKDGVTFGGPAPKADVGEVYASWDALLLVLIGGRYVTSGKVYEYMATGLPIVSVHQQDHDASTLLTGYPLWTDAYGLDHDRLVASLAAAARMARSATPKDKNAARDHAVRYDRRAIMNPAVARLADRVAVAAGAQ